MNTGYSGIWKLHPKLKETCGELEFLISKLISLDFHVISENEARIDVETPKKSHNFTHAKTDKKIMEEFLTFCS